MPRRRVLGGPTSKGYGAPHKRARDKAMRRYRPGITRCSRCGLPICDPPSEVHLDHTDDRSGYLGLSHGACNLRAGRGKQAKLALARRPPAELPPEFQGGRAW